MTALSAGGSALNKLAEQYRDNVGFYAVYILEARPTDVWQMQFKCARQSSIQQPKE